MNNQQATELIRNYNAELAKDTERNYGIAVGIALALNIMGYTFERDDYANATAVIKRYGTL